MAGKFSKKATENTPKPAPHRSGKARKPKGSRNQTDRRMFVQSRDLLYLPHYGVYLGGNRTKS